MGLPPAVKRRDFLLGFTGAVTATQAATATDGDSLVAQRLKVVPAMADLRATIPPTIATVLWLRGYHTPFDGGEGLFHWDAASKEPDNSGTIIAPSRMSNGRWKRAVNSSSINVCWFGVRGDGRTDNSTALIRLRDYMRADPSKRDALYFPPGHYQYTNNRWLWGVRSVVLDAHGAVFENTAPSGWHANMRPFNTHSIFDEDGDFTEHAPKTYNSGVRFEGAAVGDTSINLLEAENFAVGDRVLLLGYNQQESNSFTLNARYFQWKTVKDVAGSILTLDQPLQYDFRDGWRDTERDVDAGALLLGKPRVLKLDRPNFKYPKYIEINGAEFLPNPNPNAGPNNLLLSADTLLVRNVRASGRAVPAENRVAVYADCIFGGSEPDKLCDHVRFSRCTFTGDVVEATGINTLLYEDCTFYGKIQIAPRRLIMRRNRIVVPSGTLWGAVQSKEVWPTDRLVFEDNTISHDDALRHAINDGNAHEFPATSQGHAIIAPTADFAQRVAIGSFFYAKDLSDWGRVTDITHDGTNLLLHGTWKNAPTGAWAFFAIQDISESGTLFVGGDRQITRHSRSPQVRKSTVTLSQFRYAEGAERRSVLGYVHNIRVRVVAPYTGPDMNIGVRVLLDDVEHLSMPMTQVGYSEVAVRQKLTDEVAIFFNTPGGAPISGMPEEMPRIIVELDVERLR